METLKTTSCYELAEQHAYDLVDKYGCVFVVDSADGCYRVVTGQPGNYILRVSKAPRGSWGELQYGSI